VYRITTSLPPTRLLRTLLEKAIHIPTSGYSVAHPLSEQQLEALQSLLTSERCLELAKEIANGQGGGGRSVELSRDSCILALFGWQQLRPAAVSNSPSGQTILSCTYCARRILLKPSGSASPASSVNVRSAHRRWCAYLQADPDTNAKEEAWLAIFNAVTRQKPSLPKESLQAQSQDDDTQSTLQDSRLDKAQVGTFFLFAAHEAS
jgi:DNA-directed RNA polymerase subunit RPC12/RpoP